MLTLGLDCVNCSEPVPHCLSHVNLIPPCDRILLEMTFCELSKWAVYTLRGALLEADQYFKQRGISPAHNYNAAVKVNTHAFIHVSQQIQRNNHMGTAQNDRRDKLHRLVQKAHAIFIKSHFCAGGFVAGDSARVALPAGDPGDPDHGAPRQQRQSAAQLRRARAHADCAQTHR